MLIKRGGGIKEREVTPYDVYLNRRAFMLGAAALALAPGGGEAAAPTAGQPLKATPNPAYRVEDAPTPVKDVTTYNNFYEFGVNKDDPARLAHTLKPRPWTVTGGRALRQAQDLRHRRDPAHGARSRSASTRCAAWRAGPW